MDSERRQNGWAPHRAAWIRQLWGTGPIPAVKKALGDAGLTIEEMDLVEANEAFASQAIAVMQDRGKKRSASM